MVSNWSLYVFLPTRWASFFAAQEDKSRLQSHIVTTLAERRVHSPKLCRSTAVSDSNRSHLSPDSTSLASNFLPHTHKKKCSYVWAGLNCRLNQKKGEEKMQKAYHLLQNSKIKSNQIPPAHHCIKDSILSPSFILSTTLCFLRESVSAALSE